MKHNLILISIILLIIFNSGCSKVASECDPNYELTQDHIALDEELIQRYVISKQCLDGSPVQQIVINPGSKYITASKARSILYCKSENHYLVADVLGIGVNYYSFEGNPCK